MKIIISKTITKEIEVNDVLVNTEEAKQDFIQSFVDKGWYIVEVKK